MGCHFLLQCMKVKSESEVTRSCPTLRDPVDCSLPGSSVPGILQARTLEWGAIAFSASCSKQGLLSSCGAQACHCGGFSCCGAPALGIGLQQLQLPGSRAQIQQAHRSSCSGIFLGHGLNQCLLHWHTASSPLQPSGKPQDKVFIWNPQVSLSRPFKN